MLRKIIDRDAAQTAGLKRYYTGVRCKNGHDAERFVSSSGCVDCVNRKPVAGPPIDYPMTVPLRIVCNGHKAPASDEERITIQCIVQSVADDLLSFVRSCSSEGMTHEEVRRHALNMNAPVKILRVLGHDKPTPTSKPVPVVHAAAAAIDPVTGLARTRDEDGNESFRPNPYS